MSSDTGVQTLFPPSPFRTYTFDDIRVVARYARFVDGDPRRVYCFGAREITFEDTDEWVRPPSTFDEDEDCSAFGAFWYAASSGDVVFYYLENLPLFALGDSRSNREWTDATVPWDRLPSFAACLTVLELHELTHWALEDDEQPEMDDLEHSYSWNRTLADVVAEVCDSDLEWFRPGDGDFWYIDESETGVRTPAGVWLYDDYDESGETEQATLDAFDET